jgi:DNA polymerase V
LGIARTKTLANRTVKRLQPHTVGVVDLCDPFKHDWVLRNTAVKEVWGVGRQLNSHLEAPGIKTEMDLAKANARTLRMKFTVLLGKLREQASTACLELEEPAPPKPEICCSRMFGKRLTEIQPFKEAVATYVQRAAEKLQAALVVQESARQCAYGDVQP